MSDRGGGNGHHMDFRALDQLTPRSKIPRQGKLRRHLTCEFGPTGGHSDDTCIPQSREAGYMNPATEPCPNYANVDHARTIIFTWR